MMHCCIGRAGLAVFQFNLIFAAWIKFPPPYHAAAVVMTVVLGSGFLALSAVALRWSSHALAPGTAGPVRCRGASCWLHGAWAGLTLICSLSRLRRPAAAVIMNWWCWDHACLPQVEAAMSRFGNSLAPCSSGSVRVQYIQSCSRAGGAREASRRHQVLHESTVILFGAHAAQRRPVGRHADGAGRPALGLAPRACPARRGILGAPHSCGGPPRASQQGGGPRATAAAGRRAGRAGTWRRRPALPRPPGSRRGRSRRPEGRPRQGPRGAL